MATKTFPYAVIWGGEIVPANTPIEIKEAHAPEKKKESSGKRTVRKNDSGTNSKA